MLPGHRPCVPIHTGPPDDLGLRHLGDTLPLRPALQRNRASVREPPTRPTVRPDHYPRNTLCAHCCWPSVQRSGVAPHRGGGTPRRALDHEPCRRPAVSPPAYSRRWSTLSTRSGSAKTSRASTESTREPHIRDTRRLCQRALDRTGGDQGVNEL